MVLPALLSFSQENIENKLDDMMSLGYSYKQILKMTASFPTIYALSMDTIVQKIEFLVSLGYTRSDVLRMLELLPMMLGYSTENVKKKIDDLISLGFSYEEVIKMTRELPSLYSCSIENLKEKIYYLRSVGLGEIAIKNPKQLMQSVDLTYARYMYLTQDVGLDIDMGNSKLLFLEAKIFKRRFQITKKELLEKYSYDEDIRKKDSSLKKLK